MNKFFEAAGAMAAGSRLRLLSERLTQEATRLYAAYDLTLEPRWLPVLHSLAQGTALTVGELAAACGQSQPSVSQIVKDLRDAGLVRSGRATGDGRKTAIHLTAKAEALLPQLHQQIADVSAAMTGLLAETPHDLWQALADFEDALDRESLHDRVMDARKARLGEGVIIRPYEAADRDAFRALNIAWIETHFTMEAQDYKELDHPEDIIAQGGAILVAAKDGEAIGCCALIAMPGDCFELAKLAVAAEARGLHTGWKLGRAALAEARRKGARRLYLESNTALKPAIGLYRKLGFRRIAAQPSPFQRCDIQMELLLA